MLSTLVAKFYEVIIYVLLSLLVIAVAWGGWQKYQRSYAEMRALDAELTVQDKINKAVKPYLDAEKRGREIAKEVSREHEKNEQAEQAKSETVTRTVQKIVERPIYINTDCFDGDGVHNINELRYTGKS